MRLTKRFVKLLQERTGDSYVLRVDLRLRPDPGSTAVAVALPAAYGYYEMLGQNWERAAYIKARPVAGDIALGRAFLDDADALHLAQIFRLCGDRRHSRDEAPDPCRARPCRGRRAGP